MEIVRQRDLIDIVSLSRLYATHSDMGEGEACEVVSNTFVYSDELIEVYRTRGAALPECIGELNSKTDSQFVKDAILMPFRLQWWRYPACLTEIQPSWSGTPDTVAVLREDAERLLEFKLPDRAQLEATVVASQEIDPYELPEELHIANLAFRSVTLKKGDQALTFKQKIVVFLESNYSYLSPEAIQRISTVANPDKRPGPKTKK